MFKCDCGYQKMKKYNNEDYLFEIYKFSKNVFNNKIYFDETKTDFVEKDDKSFVYEILEDEKTVARINRINNKYTIADEGVLSSHLNVKSLLINVDEIKWNLLDESNVKMLFIEKNLKKIEGINLNHSYLLKYIEVSKENEYFSSEDNVLFDNDKTCLLNYPSMKKEDEYYVPSSVKKIVSRAFYRCTNLKTIYLSNKIELEKNAFFDCANLKIVYI